MDRVITRGARSLVTQELVGCNPADTYVHRQSEVFSSLLLLGSGARLGWRRHFLPVFLHEAVSHFGHCFGKVKKVIPLSMAGGQCQRRWMPSIGGCVLEFSRWASYVDQQFLAQGLPRSPLHQLAIEVTLYVVDVLPQWTLLECGLPHQFSLGMLGGPKAGWHLNTHGHVTAMPLLASHGEAGGNECVQRTLFYIGVAADRKQSQIPSPPWLGRVCWLGWHCYQDYRVFLGALQERQAVTQVRACLVGGDEDEGRSKHYGRLTLVRGRQRIMDEGQHVLSVLQVTRHVPHLRVAEPVIQYLHINQGDWKSGCPVVDARNSVPVYGYVIFHDGRKMPQEHRQEKLLKLAPFAKVHFDAAVCLFKL